MTVPPETPNDRKRSATKFLWLGLALLPIFVLVAVNTHEILLWLQTGHCPAGPMDRPAMPCGPIDFILIVLLGGWVAFLVVPALILWWLGLLLVAVLFRFLVNRRRST